MIDFIILAAVFLTGCLFSCGISCLVRKWKKEKSEPGFSDFLKDSESPVFDFQQELETSVTEFRKISDTSLPYFQNASELIQHAARQDSFFNMVLGYIPCQVFIKDPKDGFRYKIVNKNFMEYYQLRKEDVIEHPDEDIFDPDVARQLRNHDSEVCANPGKVFRYDEDISYRRRGKEVFKSLKVCFETPDHHPYMLGVCVDITDMNEMIRMERINNEALSQAVAESDFRKVVETSAQTLKNELNCSRVIFLNCAGEGKLKLFHEEYAPNLESISATGLENHEILWETHWEKLKSNNLIIYENIRNVPGIQDFFQKFPDYPTRSLAAVPIYIEEQLLGALMISYSVPHVFRETDKELLRSMSKIVSLAAIRDRQSRYMRQVEEENQALLDNISIPLWLYDAKGCVIQTNRAADQILGHVEKCIPYHCKDLLGCGGKKECPVRQVLENRKTAHERCYYRKRSYLVESSPIYDIKNGAVHGVVSSFYDVTELDAAISCRQSVNDCLTNMVRENDMMQAIHKSIRDICEHMKATRCYIMQFDQESKTVSCFLEYAHEEEPVLNQIQKHPYCADVDWEQCFDEHPLLSFPTSESLFAEDCLRSYRKSFSKYNVQSIYAHRIMLHGKLWGYVSALYERTPHELTVSENDYLGSIAYCIELMLIRQQYQSKIFDALRKAENADKAKSMFLASMSHEIRTPLNAVIGFSELLKDGNLPKQTEEDYLGAISGAGNALLALINDVLDLSKLEAGQMDFTPTEVNFPDLIKEVGKIFQPKCCEKDLKFMTKAAGEIPIILIDKLRLRQILFNLIGNAVKFTESGSITVKLKFEKSKEDTGNLEFSVADTGIGISENDQKRIFQLFVQGKALRGTQAERNGTGLGLAICKHMIEKMNGKLLLKSTLGKGSEFIVQLCDVRYVGKSGMEVVPFSGKDDTKMFGSITVLVADDVPMNLKVMKAMLSKLGADIKIMTAENANEAWEILSNNPVNFIMTDLWMPGMNGAELAIKVRQSGQYPDIVIAAVTADTDNGSNFDMSSFDMVLTKPVTIEKIRNFLGKFTIQNE